MKGFRSRTLYELHKTHPVIRIGPNSLSYGSLPAIKDIYGHGTKCLKGLFYETLSGTHFHLADVVDKAEHSRKRRALAAAYALKNLESWEDKVADKVERFIRAADKACTAAPGHGFIEPSPNDLTFDYRKWTNFFTIDAIADIGLSERLGLLDTGDDVVEAERMDGSVYKVHFRECLHATGRAQSRLVWTEDWYNFATRCSKIFSREFSAWWNLNRGWNDLVYRRASNRLRRFHAGEKLPDFFQSLMDHCEANPLEWGEIVAEVAIMMNAGSDTTAIAMNNVMYWLLKNRDCLDKLRAEVDAALGPEDVIAPYRKVKHLPYLRACLDESLRITPPTAFGLPRRTPVEGADILGDFIPGDTTVSYSAYVAHRDSTVFPEPEVYNPDRWLDHGGKNLQAYFIAFSAGARGCIGRNISYLEQTVLLASVVRRYELALLSLDWTQDRTETFNLTPGPLPVKIWRRRMPYEDEKLH